MCDLPDIMYNYDMVTLSTSQIKTMITLTASMF